MEIIGKTRIKTNSYYICKCPFCKKEKLIRFDHFKERKREDCGCFNHNDARNGKHNKLYDIHQAIKQRCLNSKQRFYHRYGGRGIKICDEWLDYKTFKKWALDNNYKEGMDLDRINNDGDYEPDNCRWIPHKNNCNNRNNTIKQEINGEILTITEIAEKYNLPRCTVETRYKRGKRGEELVRKRKFIKNNDTN